MAMEEDFRALLTGHAPITALVPAARINWREHPQGAAWPGIVLHLINDGDRYVIADVADLADARVQVDVWADTYASAKAIARAVRTRLSGLQTGRFSQIRVTAGDARARGATDDTDPPGVTLDATFLFRRS